ncbi:MAG: hypothetical protein ACQEUT_19195 [Bacillota bacterium]
MVIRKIIVSFLTGLFMIIIFSILAGKLVIGFAIGLYLLPILLIYGVPSSIVSDFITNRLKGFKRVSASFLIHILMGVFFLAAPILLTGSISGIENFFSPFVVLSAFIFWLMDEVIRSNKFRQILVKVKGFLSEIGELRI